MMYLKCSWLCILCTLYIGVNSDQCHVDNTICTNADLPKLLVSFSGMSVNCGDTLPINAVSSKPTINYREGQEGSRYVLVFSDPDAPFPCATSDGSRYLHYAAVVTLRNGELQADQELVHYTGPNPPMKTHRYQFHLFPWSSNQAPSLRNTDWSRGGFLLEQFKGDNSLTRPVAVFQFNVPSRT